MQLILFISRSLLFFRGSVKISNVIYFGSDAVVKIIKKNLPRHGFKKALKEVLCLLPNTLCDIISKTVDNFYNWVIFLQYNDDEKSNYDEMRLIDLIIGFETYIMLEIIPIIEWFLLKPWLKFIFSYCDQFTQWKVFCFCAWNTFQCTNFKFSMK